MTDKEIAYHLWRSRFYAAAARNSRLEDYARINAKFSVNAIHYIINSIDWEG